jgi:hypothetical protein
MHMTHRLRRLAAKFFAISLLAATLFTVDSLASPTPAEARCNGVTHPVRSNFIWGYERVSETPRTNTCDGNNTYTGILKDERADGFCGSVWFRESGTGNQWLSPPGGKVCGNGNTSTFQWTDRNSNSYVYQQFCAELENGELRRCGWGTNDAPPSLSGGPYGVNHGF